MRLDGEAALITGAGRGIGAAIAHAFARAGANLSLLARTRADIERVASETAACGAVTLALIGDVSRRRDTERAVATTVKKFGHLDVLVNAAGIYGPIGPLVENDLNEWVQAIEVNLLGTLFAMRAALPHMLARRKGVVVNFSGGGAVSPFPQFSAYAASKAAVVRLTETVAEEVKDSGIRVNAIAPGAVNTRLLDQVLAAGERAGKEFYAKAQEQKRNGGTSPEKAAELAVFLASPAGAGITGRLISAVWDDWKSLPERAPELSGSAMFTLRRIDGRHFTEVR
jgi:NAD(P)-dependent dehydrogenase (short-subunit alcohol dehydrogenase family)